MATYARISTGTAFQNVISATFTTPNGTGLTAVVLSLTDGTELLLSGTGMTLTGGALTAGSIASLTHRAGGGGSSIETITRLTYSAVQFQNMISAPNNGLALYNSLMSGDDNVFGGSGADSLIGAGGSDFFRGLAGNDTLDGGAGTDMTAYDNDSLSGAGIIANLSLDSVTVGGTTLAANTVRDGFGNIDTLISIEEVRGTALADVFFGGSINSGSGYNWFQGRGGADTYTGGVSTAWRDDNGGGAYTYGPASQYFAGTYWVDYRQDGSTSGINISFTDGTGGLGGTTGGSGTERSATPRPSPTSTGSAGPCLVTRSRATATSTSSSRCRATIPSMAAAATMSSAISATPSSAALAQSWST